MGAMTLPDCPTDSTTCPRAITETLTLGGEDDNDTAVWCSCEDDDRDCEREDGDDEC